jgi:hypothetical protein
MLRVKYWIIPALLIGPTLPNTSSADPARGRCECASDVGWKWA